MIHYPLGPGKTTLHNALKGASTMTTEPELTISTILYILANQTKHQPGASRNLKAAAEHVAAAADELADGIQRTNHIVHLNRREETP